MSFQPGEGSIALLLPHPTRGNDLDDLYSYAIRVHRMEEKQKPHISPFGKRLFQAASLLLEPQGSESLFAYYL